MAVFKNFSEDELIINCKCGCDEGIHFAIKNENDSYCFVSFTNGNFYKEQKHPFREKLKKIWAIIRNKDFYYSDIIMTKEDFNNFTEWINRKTLINVNMDFVITTLDKLARQNPNCKIIFDSNKSEIELGNANIYEDGYKNIVIDCE